MGSGARRVKRIDRDVPVIVLSGQGRTATVVQAMSSARPITSASRSTKSARNAAGNALQQYG
jgi:hypothetical protein